MNQRKSPRGEADLPVDLPRDLPAGDGRNALGWTTATILVATLFLLLCNAQALNGWADEQEPSETMVRVTAATEGWLAATRAMGTAGPRDRAHALWKRAQAARFAGQPPAEP